MNWDQYFMGIAGQIALRSKDRSTKVGCVIVGPDNEIRATGYNSFPRGIDDGNEARHQRPEKYLWTEHAERNAVYAAARVGIPLKGCRAYLPWFPCMDCARALVQAGIVELIATEPDLNNPKWGEDFKRVGTLLSEAGVALRSPQESDLVSTSR
jgi:dCMP deaminase